ncbi:hypothetical protein ACE7GA_07240 [Roseomonas sp. CCTCC AB2023176]|uniref:hypothetical protein n=1 Tax=Roseomonas sp. CCTCC AB2023176 TaxID=3342640 RepID=UPI0035DAAEFA
MSWGFDEPETCEQHHRAAAVFLAAFHHDPSLLDPVRAFLARLREAALNDGVPAGPAMAVITAADGLFMARIFRLYEPTESEIADLHATLLAMVEGRP